MKSTLRHDAVHGNPYACLALGYFYQTGKELAQNTRLAMEWYERAADLGCARAHWELSRIYREGIEVTKDCGKYINHLAASAELGNPDAQMRLGYEYTKGDVVSKDTETAFQWMLKSAGQGNSMSKFAVGYMFQLGIGTEKSKTEAEVWFSSAALTGDGDMFLRVGMGYEFGIYNIRKDLLEAARWYKYGVDMGHEKCILCLRSVLNTLDGGEPESLESRQKRLAESQSQQELDRMEAAMVAADEMFESGDEELAMEYYQHAADMGSPDAMFAIAMMYHQGIAVRRDDAYSVRLLARAANAGSADAQFYLASAYENGIIPTDDSQIVKLYADAAFNGFLAAFYFLGQYVDRPEVYVRRTHTRR